MVRAGWDNVVIDINNRWIFRFPRFKAAEKSLKREINLLRLLKGRLSIPIPDYRYVASGKQNQFSFAGYRKIPGMPLTHGGYRLAWTKSLASGLGDFLRELHAIKITRSMRETVTEMDEIERLRHYQKQIPVLAYKYLDSGTRVLSESFFKKSIETFQGTNHHSVLVHGDLTDRNMLINRGTGRLTGVLDWGDSAIMDPAIDFAGLFEVNRHIGHSTISTYGKDSRDLLAHVEVYWRMLPYFEILYGIYSKIPRLRNMGVKRLRKRLEAPRLSSK